MGFAMDLVGGVKRVVVVMEYEAKGKPKILKECNLPLTGKRVADLIITDLGVFTVARTGSPKLTLVELADGVSLDEIRSKTGADFDVQLTSQEAGHD